MITKLTPQEKITIDKMAKRLAAKFSRKSGISRDTLYGILADATVELYQTKPYTTAIIKKIVCGKQIRGAGFTKYNPNDERMGQPWDDSKGKYRAIGRGYKAFLKEVIALEALGSSSRVAASNTAADMNTVVVKAVVSGNKRSRTRNAREPAAAN